ncbi:hypothetical protein [Iamia sp.]|uniref:hypothetical protein n=1 Tax=Iamia sp. TaxID=2722710 RepID=UPI002C1CA4FC|nr:hypothetical protein [Iamia sp.]HXH57934.1 hypothetical protein [Iamia sp.]
MSQEGWDRYLDHRPDDLKAAQKRAKHATPKTPTGLPSGPCCGRCPNWRLPLGAKDPFGICIEVGCLTRRIGRLEKGTLVTMDELRERHVMAWEPMRVRDWAPACPRYAGSLFDEVAA